MPLEKGKIDYLFRSGMAGDTDPRVAPVGSFLDIQNAYVNKKGSLVKRNGFQRVPRTLVGGGNLGESRGLFSSGYELCIPGNRKLYALDDASGTWADRGPISPMTGSTTQFFSEDSYTSRDGLDASANDGYRLMVTSGNKGNPADTGAEATFVTSVEVRIDTDDGNVARESSVLTQIVYDRFADFHYEVKASFCQDSLLVATQRRGSASPAFDLLVHRYDTTDLSADPVVIRTIPAASMLNHLWRRRPDMCGHTGPTATGQFSLKYISPTYDLTVERIDKTGAVISTDVVPGAAAGRYIVDASISDDPINNVTLAIVVYYGTDPAGEESPGVNQDLKIALCSIDHAGAGLLWFQDIDTIQYGTDIGYQADTALCPLGNANGSPESMGVTRGQLVDGTEIVTGVYSIMRDPTPGSGAADMRVGMGDAEWASTGYLWDADEFHIASPTVSDPQGSFGHRNYPEISTGSYTSGDSSTSQTKWVRTVACSVDGTTGAVLTRPKNVFNCCLDSKPFYNGRNIYAWCSTNLNIGSGYETAFCLDLRQDYSLASELIDPPPYLVAVKDVGVCQPPRLYTKEANAADPKPVLQSPSRGAAQAADRDSLNRVLTSGLLCKQATTFRHGELLRDPASGWPDERLAAATTTVSFGDPVAAAPLADGAAVIGGAMVSWYDTQRCTELSYIAPPVFDHFWSNANSMSQMRTAGPAHPWPNNANMPLESRLPIDEESRTKPVSPGLSFTYLAIWKSYDSSGYLHRSLFCPSYDAPALNPQYVTWPPGPWGTYWTDSTGGAAPATDGTIDCNVIFSKACPITNRITDLKWPSPPSTGHSVAAQDTTAYFYRDFSNNQIFQEVNSTVDVASNGSKWWISFVDYGQDLTTEDPTTSTTGPYRKYKDPGGELLYTVGGELESIIPAGARLAIYANDRIWLAGFYHAERLAYSKKVTPEGANLQKIAPEFNEAFVITAPAGAAITALAALDDKVVAFTKDSIYLVAGDGPTSTGANNTFSALTLISSDSGCAEPRSTVGFPDGVMYQGDGGIHMLSRGLTTSFVGEGIRDITDQYPVITSAVTVPSKTQVRFTATTADGAAGVIIVYDYRVNHWMYWSIGKSAFAGGQTFVPFVGAALHKGTYYAVQADGQVWKEDVTKWKDDADNAYYHMKIKTAWLQAAQQSGWQRVYRATALCEKKADMNLRFTVSSDFNTWLPWAQVASWDDTEIATFPELPRMQPLVHVKRQQCQAVQLEITDEEPTGGVGATTGEGFTIAGFALEVGVKRGMVKVSKQQRS